MAGPEAKVKTRVKKILKEYSAYQHWPVQTGYGAACLDCHGCFKGHYFAIETKAPGKHPTPRQLMTIADIEASGGKVFVIGESVIHRKGDTVVLQSAGPFNTYVTRSDIYSGQQELEAWLRAQT